jgi:fumarate reductase flavoprotein subunit
MSDLVGRAVDVVVVGGGGAGLAAAVSAGQNGASVQLLEKQPSTGGSTALSVGSFTAAGSRHQRRKGIVDNPEDHAADMLLFNPPGAADRAPEMRFLLARESAASLHWLESLGVAFSGPYLEQPHRVPRMHNVIPHARVYIARLEAAARRLGVAITTGATETSLIVDGDRVVGARAMVDGVPHEFRTRGGVILAAGDFTGNPEMRQRFLSPAAAAASPINPHASGDGQRLGMELEAATRAMSEIRGPQIRFPEPPRPGLLGRLPTWQWLCRLEAAIVRRVPTSWLKPVVKSLLITWMSPSAEMFKQGTILVNRDGNRFCEEVEGTASLSFQPEGKAFLVFDATIATYFDTPPHSISTAPGIAFADFGDYRRGRPDLVHRAPDVRELAQRIGVDPTNLEAAIADRDFAPPLWAMGPAYSVLTITEGGLCLDDRMRVLREDGSVIEGLYGAGGSAQSGMTLEGHGHHIAWVMTSGRLAGADAAARARGH